MVICKTNAQLKAYLKNYSSIGFVPTMGALHKGHISLINQSNKQNTITVCSIFVNPTQFNNASDYANYPITYANDVAMLKAANCQVLFLPKIYQIYPSGIKNLEQYNLGFIETILEGAFRPGHYQGVCQIVYRLLSVVMPQNIYLGQKDYQQCMVIQKMINLTNLANLVHVKVCPTLREADGLAMSSRNMRLTNSQRALAVNISQQLTTIKNNANTIAFDALKKQATATLTMLGFKVDYVSIAHATTLQEQHAYNESNNYVALIAAHYGAVRLIDNMLLQ